MSDRASGPLGAPFRPAGGRTARPKRPLWQTISGIILVLIIAAVVALALARCARGGGAAAGGPGGRAGGRPTVTVGVAKAVLGDVPITLSALGTVTPEATVQVSPQVTGPLQKVNFKEGQMVRKGAVLATIDPRPFQAALDQAQGQLARDQASLADAILDLNRYQGLLKQDSIASQTVDTQAALVKQDQGTVAADRASVASARLNLSYTRIVSPASGRVGLRQIDPGNLVTANSSTPIVVVTEIDPIDVVFAVAEDTIPSIVGHANFGAGLPVTAYDRAGGAVLATGELATIDNLVDTTTGTVKGKAHFANPAGAMFPNQFVNVTVLVDTLKNQVIVPTTAIRHGPQGDYVYVLQPGNTVKVRTVKVGPATGETSSITTGLAAGETVITEGGDRLRDGAAVTLPGQTAKGGGAGGAAGAGGQHRHKHGGGGGGASGGQGGGSGNGGGNGGAGGGG